MYVILLNYNYTCINVYITLLLQLVNVGRILTTLHTLYTAGSPGKNFLTSSSRLNLYIDTSELYFVCAINLNLQSN